MYWVTLSRFRRSFLDNDATRAFDALWDLDSYEDEDETLPFLPDADLKEQRANHLMFALLLML